MAAAVLFGPGHDSKLPASRNENGRPHRRPIPGETEGASQETLVDRPQRFLQFGLPLLERLHARESPELLGVKLLVVDEKAESLSVVVGEIDDLDRFEAGRCQELSVAAPAGAHRPRSGAECSAVARFAEGGRRVDRHEGEPTQGVEERSTGSQHGELGGESAQDVRVHDGFEAAHAERQMASGALDKVDPRRDSFLDRPLAGAPEPG